MLYTYPWCLLLENMFSYLRITENDLNLVFPYTKFILYMNIVDKRTNFLLMTTIQTIFYHNLWRVKITKSAFLHKNLNSMLRAELLKTFLIVRIHKNTCFLCASRSAASRSAGVRGLDNLSCDRHPKYGCL